jgi:hypothetical protein
MAADTATLEKIKRLNHTAARLAGYHDQHKATISSSNVDKHEATFAPRTDRFVAFHVNATFTCHTGTYGSSSCSTDLHVTEEVEPYIIRAMAKHQELLFATAARLIREDAAKLTDKARAELAALVAMVDGLEAPAAAEAPALAKAGA